MTARKKRNEAKKQNRALDHSPNNAIEHNHEARDDEPSLVSVQAKSYSSYSGPLPHPSHIGQYEEILPGAADRILAMAEQNQAHRMEMDKEELGLAKEKEKNENSFAQKGQLLSFLLLMFLAACACLCVYLDSPKIAALFIATPFLVAASKVVSVFTERRRQKTDENLKANKSAVSKS